VARADLDDDLVEQVRNTILGFGRDAEVRAELAASALAGFAPIGPDHYRPVADAFERYLRP
jgi:ABC-type phosphate/phosphonate transport system, periplasmic component